MAVVTADGPGTAFDGCAFFRGLGHEFRSRVADAGHTRVGHQRHVARRQGRQQGWQPFLPVVLVVAD